MLLKSQDDEFDDSHQSTIKETADYSKNPRNRNQFFQNRLFGLLRKGHESRNELVSFLWYDKETFSDFNFYPDPRHFFDRDARPRTSFNYPKK